MPRIAAVAAETLLAALLSHADHFKGRTPPPPSHEIWTTISAELHGLMTPKAIYTAVLANRNNVQCHIGILSPAEPTATQDVPEYTSGTDIPEKNNFSIMLSEQEWFSFKPVQRHFGTRLREVLPKGVWTDLLVSKIAVAAANLSCTWSAKRGYVSKNSLNYVTCELVCKQCNAKLEVKSVDTPEGGGCTMNCTLFDHKPEYSHNLVKRHLKGQRRQEVGQDLQKMSALSFRRQAAETAMELGDQEPSDLPSLHVLQQLNYEMRVANLLDADPIKALLKMKYMPSYFGTIHGIGLDPFYFHYVDPLQLKIYKQYAKEEVSTISVDATGSLCKPPIVPVDKELQPSKRHVFLYMIVAKSNTGPSFPVAQMLSQQHDAFAIERWFRSWLKLGAPLPQVVVCDCSAALLMACARAFCDIASIQLYLTECYLALEDTAQSPPRVFIRLDVSHFVKIIASWKCLNNNCDTRVKHFYMRSICLLVNTKTMVKAWGIARAIMTVALGQEEGAGNIVDKEKNTLRQAIAGNSDFDDVMNEVIAEEFEDSFAESEDDEDDNDVTNDTMIKYNDWSAKVEKLARKNVSQDHRGTHENMHFLEALIPPLKKILTRIPLWSAVMVAIHKFGERRASSSNVENAFKDLKTNTLKAHRLPMRSDQFVTEHVRDIRGQIKLTGTNFSVLAPPPRDASASRAVSAPRADTSGATSAPRADPISRATSAPRADPTSGATSVPRADPTSGATSAPRADPTSGATSATRNDRTSGATLDFRKSTSASKAHKTYMSQDCPACTAGMAPEGSHKCQKCGRLVHALPGCSRSFGEEGYGQLRICRDCDDTLPKTPMLAFFPPPEENWGGLNPVRKGSDRSYLEPQKDWTTVDINSTAVLRGQAGVLQNGNLRPLIRIERNEFAFSNTCAFDAVMQALTVLYCDCPAVRKFVNAISTKCSELIKHLASKSVNANCYKLRAEIILTKAKPEVALASKVQVVPCDVTVGTAISSYLSKDFPSYVEDGECNICGNSMTTRFLSFLPLDLEVIGRKGISCLQEALDNGISTQLTFTGCNATEGCEGLTRKRYKYSDTTAFFEITQSGAGIASNAHPGFITEKVVNYTLEEIPTFLDVGPTHFELKSVLHYISPHDDSYLGHYVAYCRRSLGVWEEYNDLKKERQLSSKRKKVFPHVLVYAAMRNVT